MNKFWVYFNCADEIYDPACGTKLEHLDPHALKEAREVADELGLSWPPSLPEAEEYALDHREELNDA